MNRDRDGESDDAQGGPGVTVSGGIVACCLPMIVIYVSNALTVI